MKKNDWILIITLALYSFLFYKQSAGINFVIFNLALISALLIRDKQLLKSSKWLVTASGSMLSAICIGYYGNGLSITANVISLSMLSAFSYSANSSVIISLLFSFYSYASAVVFMIMEWQQRLTTDKDQNQSKRKWSLIFIPIIITLIFFFMYRSSNALFNNFTKNINLDFISVDWIFFTLGGLFLLFGFFHHQKIKEIAEVDERTSNALDPSHSKNITLFGKQLSINDEEFSGRLLFLLLNILLMVVNALDIHFMFIDNKLPAGVTYSEFVHQGTGMLITSVLMAIAIILFYFRGALNFSDKSKFIKTLAYIWIVQNAFMILSTMYRNNMYVTEYGLTYKRIGVYIYLFLTWTGLITTFIKIARIKTNAYLFRMNGWIFYFVLMFSAFINWDRFITDVNIHKAKQVQTDYLVNLSYTVLPQLFSYHTDLPVKENKNAPFLTNSIVDYDRSRDRQLYYFCKERMELDWRSWYYDNNKTYEELQKMLKEQKIVSLNLFSMSIESLAPIKQFNSIHTLNLNLNGMRQLKELEGFQYLKTLDISCNRFTSLQGIEKLKNLEYLNISKNRLTDYSPLFSLRKLKKLYVDNAMPALQFEALQQNLPTTEIIKN